MKPMNEEHLAVLRSHMVEMIAICVDLVSEKRGKSALDERVMAAMRQVPRRRFVPASVAHYAYQDMLLPIGFDKSVSQPFIVTRASARSRAIRSVSSIRHKGIRAGNAGAV